MRAALMLFWVSATAALSAQPAAADPMALRGITRVVTSIGVAAGNDPAGSCRLHRDTLDNRLVERLRAAGFDVITAGELLATYRSHVGAVRETTRLIQRGEPLPPGHAEAQGRRDAEGEELQVRPTVGISLTAAPVLGAQGETACAVAMRTRVVGVSSPAQQRVVLGGTGREVRVPLLPWESGLRMTILPARNWDAALAVELDRETDAFLEQWRRQNGR